MKKSKEEILEEVKIFESVPGMEDNYIQLLEDISDTMTDEQDSEYLAEIEKLRADLTAAEETARAVEAEWRKRYSDRFFEKTQPEEAAEPEEEVEKTNYEELFKEEK